MVRATPPVDVDVLDLDAALTRLAAFDPRKSQLAELRFFGGLSLEEAGEAVGISMATAERDWQAARAWLAKELRGERHSERQIDQAALYSRTSNRTPERAAS